MKMKLLKLLTILLNGLAGYVSSENIDHAVEVARKIRSGNVHINNAPSGLTSPFGGF